MKVESRNILLCLSSTFLLFFHVKERRKSIWNVNFCQTAQYHIHEESRQSPKRTGFALWSFPDFIWFLALEFQFFISYSMLHELHTCVVQIVHPEFPFTFKLEVGLQTNQPQHGVTNVLWDIHSADTWFESHPAYQPMLLCLFVVFL